MRKLVALVLPLAILLQACASGGPPPPATSLDPVPLATVNRAIAGEPVALHLASGEVIREAEGVVMTAESTSWLGDGDRVRTVPTAEVCKVIRQIRHRAGKGYAWGLLACVPAAVGISRANRNDPAGSFLDALLTEVVCGFAGMLVAAGFKLPRDRVVYVAPGSCGSAR
jgi:hypothetical protein